MGREVEVFMLSMNLVKKRLHKHEYLLYTLCSAQHHSKLAKQSFSLLCLCSEYNLYTFTTYRYSDCFKRNQSCVIYESVLIMNIILSD